MLLQCRCLCVSEWEELGNLRMHVQTHIDTHILLFEKETLSHIEIHMDLVRWKESEVGSG